MPAHDHSPRNVRPRRAKRDPQPQQQPFQPVWENRPILQTNDILALQRLIGNQAVLRLVKQQRITPRLQRLTVQNTQWGDVETARGSSSGASGGVMILEDSTPQGVVLKGMKNAGNVGEEQHNPQKTLTSHRVAEMVGGIQVSGTRVLGSAEKDTALTALNGLGKDQKLGRFDERLTFLDQSDDVLVMEKFEGSTLEQLAQGPQGKKAIADESDQDKTERLQRHQKFVQAFQHKPFLQALGKMLAIDTFLGHRDRIRTGGINFGNLMVSDTFQLQAIDSDSHLDQIAKGSLQPANMSGIEDIASGNVTTTVDRLEQQLQVTIGAYPRLEEYLTQNQINIFTYFKTEVTAGIKAARSILISTQTFKTMVQTIPGTPDYDPRELERRRKYLKYRQHNKQAKALKKVKTSKHIS